MTEPRSRRHDPHPDRPLNAGGVVAARQLPPGKKSVQRKVELVALRRVVPRSAARPNDRTPFATPRPSPGPPAERGRSCRGATTATWQEECSEEGGTRRAATSRAAFSGTSE